MREGDVILTPFSQANGLVKNRPAVCLREMPPYRDLLVCGVSTQLHQQVKGFDETITSGDADFAASGPACRLAYQAQFSDSPTAKENRRLHRRDFAGAA
jgi:mRNA interferase MazF